MKALLNKELKSLFYSSHAGWLAVIFSATLTIAVWVVGNWVSADDNSVSLYPSFAQVVAWFPPLFLLLIVAFSAFYFWDDRRKHKLEKLLVSPTRLYWSKYLRPLLFVSIILLITSTYVFTDMYVSGGLGYVWVIATYFSLLLICSVFISICSLVAIFVSRVWWIVLLAILIGSVVYWGLGNDYSLKYNFEEVIHGVLTSRFVVLIVNYHLIAFVLVTIVLQLRKWRSYLPFILLLVVVNVGFHFMSDWKFDLHAKQTEQDTQILNREPKDIAFIEGHGEVEQVYLLDAEQVLAHDYNIHRGEIGTVEGVLDGFAAILIVGPTQQFSEGEKRVLDQYIMQGGRVLCLIDGVYVSHHDLKTQGWSASIKNEVALDDLLFAYGVRIKPQLIVDQNCDVISLISKESGSFTSRPNHFAPMINIDWGTKNLITHNVSILSTNYMSPVDTLPVDNVIKHILFSSSSQSNIVTVPERIDFTQEHLPPLNQSLIPMAVTLQGRFPSAYASHRSVDTKMIVIGCSSLITNELQGKGDDTDILPMGYNRHTQILANNREFLHNAINWLTDDTGIQTMDLKNDKLVEDKNIGLPLFLTINLLIPFALYYILFFRGSIKRKQHPYEEI